MILSEKRDESRRSQEFMIQEGVVKEVKPELLLKQAKRILYL
jgi:hypothetical protein